MKLNDRQQAVVTELTSAVAMPEDDPAYAQLCENMGEHTYYLDTNGLHIFEPMEVPGEEGQQAVLIQIAAWTDENMSAIQPCDPRATSFTFDLDAAPQVEGAADSGGESE